MNTASIGGDRRPRVLAVIAWLIAGACAATPPAEESAPDTKTRYQPFYASYEGVTRSRIEQTFNEQLDVTEVGMRYYVSAAVIQLDTALHATLVIDSVSDVIESQIEASRAQVDSARGVTYTGTLSRTGFLNDLAGGEGGGTLADEVSSRLLTRFFPLIPDSGVEPGASWSDTVETTETLGGVENTVNSIRRHEAAEWTQFLGSPALLIVTESDYTFSGAGVQVGQSFTLEGRGRRYSQQYLGTDGSFLGLVSADTSEAEANLTEAGIVIPVHQTRADTLKINQ